MPARTPLFVDKLSLTLPVNARDSGDVKLHLDQMNLEERLVREANPYSDLLKNYRYAYKLFFYGECFCSIQISPHRVGHRFMRLEWNPSKARYQNIDPLSRIVETLSECIPSFSIEMLLAARITRIDLAFDLHRIRVDSFFMSTILRKSFSGQYMQMHQQFGPKGYTNARYIGKADSDQYLLVYDKNLEARTRQNRGIPPANRRPVTVTRFELRLRDVGTLDNLYSMQNPFQSYLIVSRINAGGVANNHEWQFFIAACELYGSYAALSMIENQRKRSIYRKALHESTWPSPSMTDTFDRYDVPIGGITWHVNDGYFLKSLSAKQSNW